MSRFIKSNIDDKAVSFGKQLNRQKIAQVKSKKLHSQATNYDPYETKKEPTKPKVVKKKTFLLLIFYLVSIAINILSILLFAVESEMQPSDSDAKIFDLIDFIFSNYFLFELCVNLKVSGTVSALLRDPFFYVDISTIIISYTAFFLGKDVNINFLRVIRALKIIRINKILKLLRIKENDTYFSIKNANYSNLVLFSVLSVFIIFFISAGLVSVINEIIPGSFNISSVHLINSLYFLLISMTTIGYGDIVPTNALSRFVILSILTLIIYVIIVQILKRAYLLKIISGEDYEFKIDNHIVVCGYLTKTGVDNFIQRFFRERIKNNKALCKIVFIVKKEETTIIDFINDHVMFGKLVFFIIDSFHNNFALLRVNAHKARVVVLANYKEEANCYIDDFGLWVAANKLTKHDCQLFCQSLVYSNSLVEDRSQIIMCLLKGALVAKSLYCKGFGTFISNLIDEDTKSNSLMKGSIEDYRKGKKMKLIVLKFPSHLNGELFGKVKQALFLENLDKENSPTVNESFTELAKDKESTMQSVSYPLLIGLINMNKEHKKDYIMFNPKNKTINSNDQGIFIFSSQAKTEFVLNSLKIKNSSTNNKSFYSYCQDTIQNEIRYESKVNGKQALKAIMSRDIKAISFENFISNLTNHIVILGYSILLETIVACIRVNNYSVSIIVAAFKLPEMSEINRLLRKFYNFRIIEGNILNPEFLLKDLNIKKAQSVIIISNSLSGTENDSQGILTSKLIENYVRRDFIHQIDDQSFAKYISPVTHYDDEQVKDEFFSSAFISGKLVFCSLIDQLVPLKVLNKPLCDILEAFILLNYERVHKFIQGSNEFNNEIDLFPEKLKMFSFLVPEKFHGKQYGCLVRKILEDEDGLIPLGLYSVEKNDKSNKSIEDAVNQDYAFFFTNPRMDIQLKKGMTVLLLGEIEMKVEKQMTTLVNATEVRKISELIAMSNQIDISQRITKVKNLKKAVEKKIASVSDLFVRK